MKEDEDTLMGLGEETVLEMMQDHEEAGKWAGELPEAGIERLQAIKQAAGEMLGRTNARTMLLGKVIAECLGGNLCLAGWTVGLVGGAAGKCSLHGRPEHRKI